MNQNQPGSGTTDGINEWRNPVPIYQHFAAPSTTYVNMFRQPGAYNITIGLPGSVARMVPPSRIPNRQAGMTFDPRNQANVGGGLSMTRPYYSHEGQIRQTTMPGTSMQGNGLGFVTPVGARSPQNKSGEPAMMMTPTPDFNSREGQMEEVFPPTPPASSVASPVGPHSNQLE